MPRWMKITLIATSAGCAVLAVALAIVGSQFDKVRLDNDDLEAEVQDLQGQVDGLQSERDALAGERDKIKAQVDEQLQAIERLKAENGRVHGQPQASTTAPATP